LAAQVIINLQTGEFVDANDEAATLLGRSREELLAGRQAPEFRSLERLSSMVWRRAERLEAELVRPEGYSLPVVITAYPIEFPGKEIVLALFREEQEAQARTRKEEFARAMGHRGIGLALVDRDMRVQWVNIYHEGLFGPLSELRGRICYEAFEARTSLCPNCPVIKTFESGEESWGIRYNRNPKIGVLRFFLLRTAPILNDAGQVESVLELVHEIEEPKPPDESKMSALKRVGAKLVGDFGLALASFMGSSPLALVQIEPKKVH